MLDEGEVPDFVGRLEGGGDDAVDEGKRDEEGERRLELPGAGLLEEGFLGSRRGPPDEEIVEQAGDVAMPDIDDAKV